MKVRFKGLESFFHDGEVDVIKDFVKFLQSQAPLNEDITITLLENRDLPMTTGVRMPGSEIFVLAGGRLMIDIMRTLSHEWIHEFQHQKLGVKDFEKHKDIGGPIENMANILSGIFLKKFDKKYPNYSALIYGETQS
jgi:hypothetical protein